jgi:branched-chain amino acid transport system ATP-binding protein
MQELLVVEDIHTYYGEAHILQGVSVSVGQGEVVTVIGRNGAGKTTTLRSIMGIARTNAASAYGREIRGGDPRDRAPWTPAPASAACRRTRLCSENLRLGNVTPGSAAGAARTRRLRDVPAAARAHRPAGRFLSGGEQQMLAIARGLVARPKLMLVDEPTEGLAPILVQQLTEILRRINQTGTTILLVEQTLEVALALSHRLYVMDQGRIQFSGTPEQLARDPTIQQRFLEV